jgi:hypothetical protein
MTDRYDHPGKTDRHELGNIFDFVSFRGIYAQARDVPGHPKPFASSHAAQVHFSLGEAKIE